MNTDVRELYHLLLTANFPEDKIPIMLVAYYSNYSKIIQFRIIHLQLI